jgi:hypothetical protein
MTGYGLSDVARGIRKPKLLARKLLEVYQLRLRGRGVNVVDREWDNLLILDACRYDAFRDEHALDGELEPVYSLASQTVQFLHANFGDGDFPEIVYVSANPNITQVPARFHERIRLWETHWDDDLDVVPPDAVTDETLAALDAHPNKRLVVHYMQPHFPFIGEFGRSLYEDDVIDHYGNGREFWAQMNDPAVDKSDVIRAYRENLRVALAEVERLLADLPGRTVVTADHGNEFGKWGIYGHPTRAYTENLVKVPWFTVAGGESRDVEPGRATAGPARESDELESQLEALGYA